MNFKQRFKKIKKVIFSRPYIFYFIFIFLAYIFINLIINKVTVPVISTYKLKFIIPYLFLNILIAFLIAVNVNLIILKFREIKQLKTKDGGLTFMGVFGGLLGGACPGCFVGLFPAFLGLFGITASLSILPLYGIELQIGSVILLIVSLVLLTKNNICKIEIKEKKEI